MFGYFQVCKIVEIGWYPLTPPNYAQDPRGEGVGAGVGMGGVGGGGGRKIGELVGWGRK